MKPDESESYIGRVVTPEADGAEAGGAKGRAAAPKKSAGRWAMLNTFADVTARTLPLLAGAVWYQLFRMANSDGRVQLSQAELARRIGKSERATFTALRKLEEAGVLTVVHRGSMNAGPTIYRIRARRKDDR